ncbi:MAG: DivIVA domain-containing protein [Clostridia bacterium]
MKQTDDIINKEFSRSFMGYDMQEVDLFLDLLIERFEKLETERKEMLTAMEYLLKKLDASGELTEPLAAARQIAAENVQKHLNALPARTVMAGPVHVQQQKLPRKLQKVSPITEPAKTTMPMTAGTEQPVVCGETEAEQPPIPMELETGESAPDMDALIPQLLSEMEQLFSENSCEAVSCQDKPGQEESNRVS